MRPPHPASLTIRLKPQTGRLVQLLWLAFTLLALSLALPGLPHHTALLQIPCDNANCIAGQLTARDLQAMIASDRSAYNYALTETYFLLFVDALLLGMAALFIWQKPTGRVAALAAFVSVALATSTYAQVLAHVYPALWFPAQCLLFVQMAGLLPLFCLLPDGRFQPRWLQYVALAYVMINLIYLTPNYEQWIAPGTTGGALWTVFSILSALIIVGILLYRYRASPTSAQQEQMLWALVGLGLAAASQLLGTPLWRFLGPSLISTDIFPASQRVVVDIFGMLLAVGCFTCLLVALLNYELFDADILLNRALVYGALTALVIGVYGLVVGYLSVVFQSSGNVWFSLIATGLAAVLAHPLRIQIQQLVNRLMYGERDDPYAVLSRFGQRLETTLASDAILPTIVETITQTLKLPYAALRLNNETTIAHGALPPNTQPESFPLVYQGEIIGQLGVTPRAAAESFTPAERRLLTDLAHQAGVAAHAVRLTTDLQQARERLVTAREEERRRLRRDLHDGLGPKLAGQALILEAVRDSLMPDSQSHALVAHLIEDSQSVVSEIRELVQGLRPPALDEFGLVSAVRSLAAQCEPGQLRVTVTAPDPMPPLPAAVEVAAYRIAQEALTNVVKHAQATNCQVRLAFGDSTLRLDVQDNGLGLPATRRPGVGLSSMRERAEEIGGSCVVEAGINGGICVTAQLPITNYR